MMSLENLLRDEGVVASSWEEYKRKNVIIQLQKILDSWIRIVHATHEINRIQDYPHATILTFGSYGLGVYNAESDIDALCVGPWYASMDVDFFVVLRDMLEGCSEVSEIHCIKDAKVPLMRFKFKEIWIDMPYARLKDVPYYTDDRLDHACYLNMNAVLDETSWNSLSGVLVNYSIRESVPNLEEFKGLLRCVKLWAKRRGVYGNLFGFFGGVHLAALSTYICQRNPIGSGLAVLVKAFFETFASWPWPEPVLLQDAAGRTPFMMMPIQLPGQLECCHSNVSVSTRRKIKAEFVRAYHAINSSDPWWFDWRVLFEPFPYSTSYQRFVRICVSTSNQNDLYDWVGRVKSRFRWLLVKFEQVLDLCDPNPTEYVDKELRSPNIPNIVFYWGLLGFRRGGYLDLETVEREFIRILSIGYQGHLGQITLSIVQASTFVVESQGCF